jgi:1-pyrroline-5-carboxylate dehydrogenase
MEANFKIPKPVNEPILGYLPNSKERNELKEAIQQLKGKQIEIPLVIGGKKIKSGNIGTCIMPHNHKHVLGTYHKAGAKEINDAIEASLEAREKWSGFPWYDRASIFLKAADLLAGPYRAKINAAAMLNMSKNPYQAEIDAACELIDFFRFNTYYMQQIYEDQPYSPRGQWNRVQYRPLEGFVFAVTPFNFASIAGNLPSSPAMMGNVVLWKPASSAVYIAHFLMEIFEQAGVPPGVINFVPGSGAQVGDPVLDHPSLAGVHFTGSTATFQGMWKKIGTNIGNYKTYPRIVGETGGKDFIFVHNSADLDELVTATIRGAFEYAGQKCSAASRASMPESIWDKLKKKLLSNLKEVKMGDVEDFRNLVNAVIDKAAFDSISGYINEAKSSNDAEIIFGGKSDDSIGYFIEPTVILAKDPKFRTMCEEIFGPVLTIYVYPDDQYEQTLKICNDTSPYALTGAIFGKDRYAIKVASYILRDAAGNFYINDKPTGAVVGQQPFGGARASGTNDKAGSYLNLIRWISTRSIKENFVPPKHFSYPYMSEP